MANIFPKWTNSLPLKIGICVFVAISIIGTAIPYYFTQKYTRVGYEPQQVIPFSHKIHAGELGMDCRYCHSNVDKSPHSNIPSSQLCMNCHQYVLSNSAKLQALRDSVSSGEPLEWTHVHKMPDYVFFDHSVHVNRGVGCVDCHGRIDQMEVVSQAKPMSMSWCLDCHRNSEKYLRPVDKVTNLDWKANDISRNDFIESIKKITNLSDKDFDNYKNYVHKKYSINNSGKKMTQKEIGAFIKESSDINPSTSCFACHR